MDLPCGHKPPQLHGCDVCDRFRDDPRYSALVNDAPAINACRFLEPATSETVDCDTCWSTKLKLFGCKKHKRCTLAKKANGVQCCNGCPDKQPPVKWAYGVTTVPERQFTYLLKTLDSLAAAGFPSPRLFVDGAGGGYREPVTYRIPRVRTYANWFLSLGELYFRDPHAERYCVFQDDLVCYRNLRKYLDDCPYPDRGYWNLFSFMDNEEKLTQPGWVLSNQLGRGALALVFDNGTCTQLLSSAFMILKARSSDPDRNWKSIDGGVVTALKGMGVREYVHNPSLVMHIGAASATQPKEHGGYPPAKTFRGESFDATSLRRP